MKVTKLFKSGGSFAVRLPRAWVPESGRVVLHREANRIVITEAGSDLREVATRFAEEGRVDFERPEQPLASTAKKL